MIESIESFSLSGDRVLSIHPDPDPMDPRKEYDHLGKMVCFHKRYLLGDNDTGLSSDMFQSWKQLEDYLYKTAGAVVVIPIYMIDHSGISIRCHDFSGVDPGHWDSGQIGYIYASRADVLMEYNKKHCSKKMLNEVREVLCSEVTEYDDYLTGNVYGYTVTDQGTGEIVESCWGFVGNYRDTIIPEFGDQIQG